MIMAFMKGFFFNKQAFSAPQVDELNPQGN